MAQPRPILVADPVAGLRRVDRVSNKAGRRHRCGRASLVVELLGECAYDSQIDQEGHKERDAAVDGVIFSRLRRKPKQGVPQYEGVTREGGTGGQG